MITNTLDEKAFVSEDEGGRKDPLIYKTNHKGDPIYIASHCRRRCVREGGSPMEPGQMLELLSSQLALSDPKEGGREGGSKEGWVKTRRRSGRVRATSTRLARFHRTRM